MSDLSKLKKYYVENGRFMTRQIFVEHCDKEKKDLPPLYTLKQEDGEYPSAYKIYMESVDEYDAAIKLVGNLTRWEYLSKGVLFEPHLETWRRHMKLRDESMAKKVLLDNVEKGQTTAANSLKSWDKAKKTKGRPKKPTQSSTVTSMINRFNTK